MAGAVSSLCEAVLRQQVRRGRSAGAAGPIGVGMLVATAVAPFLAWRTGNALSRSVAPALGDMSVARALALGLVLAAAAVGATLAASLPPPSSLGLQVVAAPVSRRALVVASALPLLVGALLVGVVLGVPLVVALCRDAPGGIGSALSLACALTAAVAAGACLVEACLRVVRGVLGLPAAAAGGAVLAAVLAVVTASQGFLGLDIRGAVACSATVAAAGWCVSCWVVLASQRHAHARVPRRRRRRRSPGRRVSPHLAAPFAVLARAPELRLALVTAVGFGLLGLAVGRATGAPASAALVLGGGSCAVTAGLVPLAVRGRIDAAAWVWRVAGRMAVASLWAAASLLLVGLAAGLVCAVAVAGGGGAAAAPVAALALLVWSAALAAGALVPRSARTAGTDALHLVAFAGVAVVFAAAGSGGTEAFAALGVPAKLAAAAALGLPVAAAVTLLATGGGRR